MLADLAALENLEHPSATRQQAFRSRCGHCRVGRVDASAGELNYCLNRSWSFGPTICSVGFYVGINRNASGPVPKSGS
jgi:hypothetical protein